MIKYANFNYLGIRTLNSQDLNSSVIPRLNFKTLTGPPYKKNSRMTVYKGINL
jgi:hypothetical protein